jgi:hypothetical protein
MRRMIVRRLLSLVVLTLASSGQAIAGSASPRVIFEWNQIAQDTIPGAGGAGAPRFFALTHIAMFDAVTAIEREFEPYHVRLQPGLGSPDAAAAQAAHDVLVALNPPAAAAYDALLRQHLGENPNGFVQLGAKTGAAVAAAVLAWRMNDGWIVASFPPYSLPPFPGLWQPTPPANAAAIFTHTQQAAPLAMASSTQFLPVAPPVLTSARYAADLNEVKSLGKSDSATRTPDQMVTARVWAGIGASGTGTATAYSVVWNNIARNVASEHHLTLGETARLFVLMNVSIHDALQTTLTSKFVYGMWRPITAIRQADTDLNAATDADPTWATLIPTPPYPSYAGNMASIGASAARALALAVGTNDVPVSVTWRQSGGQSDVVHHFASLWEIADEQAMSRVYGGIHFRFDNDAGQTAGKAVADYVFANFMHAR